MKKLLITLLLLLPAAAFGTCVPGGTCFTATLTLNNANQSTSSPLVIYTAPSIGSGAIITALWVNTTVVDGTNAKTNFYIIHNSVTQLLNVSNFRVLDTNVDILFFTDSAGVAIPLQHPPTDSNGNPYLPLGPGDSLAIANAAGIPSSGTQSGNYNFTAVGASF